MPSSSRSRAAAGRCLTSIINCSFRLPFEGMVLDPLISLDLILAASFCRFVIRMYPRASTDMLQFRKEMSIVES